MFVIWPWIFARVWRKILPELRSQRKGQKPVKERASPEMNQIAKLVSGRLKTQAAGPHPDPDLLAAFAENALPDTDRARLLHHLGTCPDCREILYLTVPDSL